tara:strand:- start:862 stop:1380 length:519 start_codon:yes stop_codon:yes gene_type:complete
MTTSNAAKFQAPIPGQSLTTELGSRPWERPAKYSDPEEALRHYTKTLSVPATAGRLFDILESGFPVTHLVDGLTLGGVMQGLHTVDIAVIISPAIYEFITGIADLAEIDYETGLEKSDQYEAMDSTILSRAQDEPEAQRLVEKVMDEEQQSIKEAASSLMSRPQQDELEGEM